LLVAACGGSAAHGNSSQPNRAVAYAHCLRVHGVSNWPDPESNGVFDKSKLSLEQLGVSTAQLQAAQTACVRLAPNGGRPPNQAQVQQIKAQALQFSECVRGHGIPTFPDPGRDGRIPDPASVGIDQGSPRFQAANEACGKYRPPYMPSNADYDAWARTHGGSR
jgi:hypothetical protein